MSTLDGHPIQHLRDHAVGLFQQGQQEMFHVDLVVPVAHQDFIGAGRCILQALRKTIKTHHALYLFPVISMPGDYRTPPSYQC
jgi:hypothetical protein